MPRAHDNAPGSGGAYWMLIPAVAFTVILIGLPFLYTIYLSLHQFVFGKDALFNAGRNYLLMLQDRLFWNGLWVTLLLYLISLALQMAFDSTWACCWTARCGAGGCSAPS